MSLSLMDAPLLLPRGLLKGDYEHGEPELPVSARSLPADQIQDSLVKVDVLYVIQPDRRATL